jgi:hypothetical protein
MKLIGKMWQIRVAKLGDKLFAIWT